jgi:ribosomal 50S subunit-recycling heat shock protein
MRLDKFIAVARLLKTRSLVKTATDEGMVFVNGRRAKPAAIVRLGDVVEIDTPRFYKKIKVIDLPVKNMRKTEAVNLYDLLEEREKELF